LKTNNFFFRSSVPLIKKRLIEATYLSGIKVVLWLTKLLKKSYETSKMLRQPF
jgi:hypothetical protein